MMPLLVLLGCNASKDGDSGATGPVHAECASPASSLTYTEVGAAWGLVDTTDDEYFPGDGGGVTIADLDEDGLDDVILAPRNGPPVIHWNEGGAFRQEPIELGIVGHHVAAVDIDGDRHLDLFVNGPGSEDNRFLSQWLLGDGAGNFALHATPGVPYSPGALHSLDAADLDRDGDLDVLLAYLGPDMLLLNDGAGGFTSVFEDHFGSADWTGLSWVGVFQDLDVNGWPDVFVANDLQQNTREWSRLYMNVDGQFSQATAPITVNAMGGSALDYDNDGDVDLFVTGTGPNGLYQNYGDGVWVDVSNATGARGPNDIGRMHMSSATWDMDNDGWVDIVTTGGRVGIDQAMLDLQDEIEPDALMRNECGVFTDIGGTTGFSDDGDSRGVAVGDLNNDGMPDLVVGELGRPSRVHLAARTDARALDVELVGVSSNAFGIGARVEARTPSGVVRGTMKTLQGRIGNGPMRVHLGLGTSPVEGLTVYWPSGQVQEVEVEAGVSGRITVTEPG
jgi:hypothetical protein